MDDPVGDLLRDYTARRASVVTKTAGRYLDGRKSVLGAADSMIDRVQKGAGTLLAIREDERTGLISTEQAGKLRKTVLEDARSYIDKTTRATSKVLTELRPRLLDDAYPLHHERSSATAEAKRDLDLELSQVPADALPTALADTVRRRYSEGDAVAGDLLMGAHGRDRLKAGRVADAEKLHADIRRSLAAEVPTTHLQGDRANAAATLANFTEWEKTFVVGLSAADVMLRDLEAGRLDGDA